MINIVDIAEKKIHELNNRISSWSNSLTPKEFLLNNYVELKLYQQSHTKFIPSSFLAFASYQQLLSLEKREIYKPLWYFKSIDSNNELFLKKSLGFLVSIIKDFNELFESGRVKSALILFRSYIESATTLFLCTIDFEFYKSNLDKVESLKDEINLWLNTLSPSKVKKALKKHHAEYKDQFKHGTVFVIDQRDFIEYSFVNEDVNGLYGKLSKIAHGNINFLNELDEDTNLISHIHFQCATFLLHSVQILSSSLDHYLQHDASYDFRRALINVELWYEFYKIRYT